MTPVKQFTPEIALAMAVDYLSRNESMTPPIGTPVDKFITGRSATVVLDLRQLDNPNDFGMAFTEVVAQVKRNLRNALIKSGWADSHHETGFQFITYLCDENGKRLIDIGSNRSADATGIGVIARLFAHE